jgi:hypothetical protein
VCIRSEKPDDGAIITRGQLLNISLGGALVSVQDYVPRRQPCSVEIYGAVGRVIPNYVIGRVVGTSVDRRGDFLLRIEFAEPLITIKEPGEM